MAFSTKITDDLLHIAAHVTDFGELGRFDLDERCARELGEAARDFRLTDASWPDHQNVLRIDLVAQIVGQLLAAPTVAQGDGDSALGIVLADDKTIQLETRFRGG